LLKRIDPKTSGQFNQVGLCSSQTIQGRDSALRCPRRRAQRQATETIATGARFIRFVAPQPGADGAARHPNQLRTPPKNIKSPVIAGGHLAGEQFKSRR